MRIWVWIMGAVMWAAAATAQSPDDIVWVQVEAHPSLSTATDRVRVYENIVDDVNGFDLGAGWYGIALGPYRRDDAAQVLRVFRSEGLIPRDSFIATGDGYDQQFWPIGANLLERGVIEPPEDTAPVNDAEAPVIAEVAPEPEPEPADETPAEARRSEQQLSRAEREALQIALKWAGTYAGAIDGAFGRGTRGAMASWQTQNGFDDTGILTSAQRVELLRQYNAVLDGLGLQLVTDAQAGIEIKLPTDIVTFARYESPFAQYDATGKIAEARVLLISQPGDRDTLYGLYDILQTLDIVPLDGPRERGRDDFVLVGQNDRFISETRARLSNGAIKGFMLVWPAGDEERRTRLLSEMEASFTTLDAVLDPGAGDDAAQAVDLVAGLSVRTPRVSRSGFFVDDTGTVITTADAVANCTRITLDQQWEARIAANAGGIAVLRPNTSLAPLAVAQLGADAPRLGSEIVVAGYSYEGVLNAPSVTFGTFADVRGLDGDAAVARLEAETLPGDAGGPVIDATGAVVGMVLPRDTGARALPGAVAHAAKIDALMAAATAAGVETRTANAGQAMAPAQMASRGADMTVLVSCWD